MSQRIKIQKGADQIEINESRLPYYETLGWKKVKLGKNSTKTASSEVKKDGDVQG
jgi:hypothetical protein